jgi:hypothetical protein
MLKRGEPVMVDGYPGREVAQVPLEALMPRGGQERSFREVYITTESGDQFGIFDSGQLTDGRQPGRLLVLNRSQNLDRIDRGQPQHVDPVPRDLVSSDALRVGASFDYEKGATTRITGITVVNTTHRVKDASGAENGIRKSDVRQAFWKGLKPEQPKKPEVQKSPEKRSLSVDDEKLTRMMLYPDRGPLLYSKLVGDRLRKECKPWEPRAQARARRGVQELIATEMEPVRLDATNVEHTRRALANLQRQPRHEGSRKQLERAGRHLHYQNVSDYDLMKLTGDFLHFGINYNYDGAHDKLKSGVRVYVTPKMEAVGHVAAQVVRRARAKGYEPYGKLFDESSNTTDTVSPRQDRLLFYVRTTSQLHIIMDALKEVQQEESHLFEPDPPLLSRRTKIPGVGLAEEPPQDKERQSYNQSREDILHEAWKKVVDDTMGKGGEELISGNNGMIIDKRVALLRRAVERGQVPIEQIVDTFRAKVRGLSEQYGIDPENFSRNLRQTKRRLGAVGLRG